MNMYYGIITVVGIIGLAIVYRIGLSEGLGNGKKVLDQAKQLIDEATKNREKAEELLARKPCFKCGCGVTDDFYCIVCNAVWKSVSRINRRGVENVENSST